MTKTKIALITVDFNGHEDTRDLLASFPNLRLKPDWEILWVLVDNGSDQPLSDTVPGNNNFVILQTGENTGFAGGYNRGLEYAMEWGAEYFLLINNDTMFMDPGLLVELVGFLHNHPSVGVVAPKILFAPGFEYHKDRYTKKDLGRVIWYAGGTFDWANVTSIHRGLDEVDTGRYDRPEQAGFLTGCCLLIRRPVLEQVGLLDSGMFAYFEDNDWLMRIKQAGWETWYHGGVSLHHKVSRTAGIGSPVTDYYLTRNRLIFGRKFAPWRTKLALYREAVRLLLTGRPSQKRGVLDFIQGRRGPYDLSVSNPGKKIFPYKLSIVIINYRTCDLTLKLLESIFRTDSGFSRQPTEVIVLDNASGDDCLKKLMPRFPEAAFIQNSVNTGFSGGNNQMIRLARGEYILLLNSDIEVHKDSLSSLVSLADISGRNAVITGKLIFPDGTVQDSCFRLPSVTGAIKEYFLKIKGSYFMYLPPGREPSRVEGAVMACFMIPRTVINHVGLLSEKTFMYFEDVEYCRRLKQAEIPVLFHPQARFTHHHGASSKKIGLSRSQDLLKKGSLFYHGRVKYLVLWVVLWLGQRIGRVTTPVSRWAKA